MNDKTTFHDLKIGECFRFVRPRNPANWFESRGEVFEKTSARGFRSKGASGKVKKASHTFFEVEMVVE